VKLALAAVQLTIDADVLASGDAYRAHIETAARAAMVEIEKGGAWDHGLLVFPELAGHLALLALAPPAAHRAKTVAAALGAASIRRPLDVLRGVVTTRLLDPRHAVMAALAPDAEKYWRGIFGPLARAHRMHVCSGSHLRLGSNGELTSSSFMFAPDGRLLATTSKVNLVPGVEDRAPGGLGLARGDAEVLPIVDAPFGKLATLIGYDAAPEPITELERFIPLMPRLVRRGGVTVVANPESDRRATEGHRAGLGVAMGESPFARWGVTAHLVGEVLDLSVGARSEILERTATGTRVLARAESGESGAVVAASVSL
jgi:predicted amidohydrolase